MPEYTPNAAPAGTPGVPLLEVSGLTVEFRDRRRTVRAVSDVSLRIEQGKTLGLVGESGSGKTTIGRAILGLVPAAAGRIVFDGRDITRDGGRQRRRYAGQIRAVFQDPYSSLNPALKVSASLLEGLAGGTVSRAEARARLAGLLERVGLPSSAAAQYPGTFSGGQRQRLAIARALMSSPRLVICDEPVSALDVSVQAQVLNLLRDLQRASSLSYLFIGHDLDVVRYMSDRIAVLYRGHLVEEGPSDIVARTPRHPYTRALLAAVPGTARPGRHALPGREAAAGQPGEPQRTSGGCPYAPRCPLAVDPCWTDRPPLAPAAGGGSVACQRYEDVAAADGQTPAAAASAPTSG